MAQLVIVILDDLHVLPALLAGWRKIGVPGATILQSVGAHRATTWLSHAGLGALGRLFEAEEVRRRTVLAAIDEELVGRAVAEAERVVGGFNRPNSGLLLVVPVIQVLGLTKTPAAAEGDRRSAGGAGRHAVRAMPVRTALAGRGSPPPLIPADTPLPAAMRIMREHPQVQVAPVVADDQRLVGLLDVQTLVDSLLVHVFPEEYLSTISDLEEVRQFADRSQAQRAQDVMRPPQAIEGDESVREAFHRMHAEGLPGLPIVDGQYRVVGYVSILELLAMLAAEEGDVPDTGGDK